MADAVGDLFVAIGADTSGLAKGFSSVEGMLGNLTSRLSGASAKWALGFVSLGAVIGGFALKAWADIDKGTDAIRTGTGATGEALDGLKTSMLDVGKQVPASFDEVGKAIADLNTRLGITGEPLENLAVQFVNLSKITGGDVSESIRLATRLFGDWSVTAEKQSESLDYLFRVSQSTGIGVDALAEKMTFAGVPLRQLGFDFQSSAAMVGKWEKEGVNVDMLMRSLNISSVRLAKQGVPDMSAAWKEMTERIKDASTETEAITIATEYFGAKAASNMAGAIREGRFEIDALKESLAGGTDTINKAAKDSYDFGENLTILKNNVYALLEPLGNQLAVALDKVIQKITEWIREGKIAEWADTAKVAITALWNTIKVGFEIIDTLIAHTIGWKNAVLGLIAVWVGFKIVSLLQGAIGAIEGAVFATSKLGAAMGGVGTAGAALLLAIPIAGIVGIGMAFAENSKILKENENAFNQIKAAWKDLNEAERQYTIDSIKYLIEWGKAHGTPKEHLAQLQSQVDEMERSLVSNIETIEKLDAAYGKWGNNLEGLSDLTASEFGSALDELRTIGAEMVADGGQIPDDIIAKWQDSEGKARNGFEALMLAGFQGITDSWEKTGQENISDLMLAMQQILDDPEGFKTLAGTNATAYFTDWISKFNLGKDQTDQVVQQILGLLGLLPGDTNLNVSSTDNASPLINNLAEFMSNFWAGWGNTTISVDAYDGVSGVIDRIREKMNSFWRGFGHSTVGIHASGAPGTALGGVVSSRQLRIVGEAGPEAIIPLGKMDAVAAAWNGGSSGPTINIQNLSLPGVKDGYGLVDDLNRIARDAASRKRFNG